MPSLFIYGGAAVGHRLEDMFGCALSVSDAHGFGLDALLLAEFSAPRPGESALDLCSGCGVIPAFWLASGWDGRARALDIAPEAAELCRVTAEKNGWGDRLAPVCGDLREHVFGREEFSLVTANPPYFSLGTGRPNASDTALAARSELSCTLEDVVSAAAYALRFGGRFCLCHRPERLADVMCSLRGAGLEPKRLTLVSHRAGGRPWLLLAEAKKGGGRGLVTELRTDSDFRAATISKTEGDG